jgi:hypothetical protein
MQHPTSFPSSGPRHAPGAAPGTAPGIPRKRPIRLIILIAQTLIIMLLGALGARAQLVVNGSFETYNAALAYTPGWSYSGPPIAFPGVPGWWALGGSVDVFSGAYVPCNFMTSGACRTPFDGNNYGGISTGTFYGVGFSSESIGVDLVAPISAGNYQIHARIAMGSGRNNPGRVQFWLLSSTTAAPPLVLGSILVNNTNWNLFSQPFTLSLPAGYSYDRIKIQGVPDADPANNIGAYMFIDSVDISGGPPGPCALLAAHMQYAPGGPSGGPNGCCWNLLIDNNLPASMGPIYSVRLTSIAPTTLSGSVTDGPGMTSTSTTTTATWSTIGGGQIPNGSGQLVGGFCLNAGTPPQKQIVEFLDADGTTLCTDTLWTDCQQTWQDCMDLSIEGLHCGPIDADGNRTYPFTLNVNVLSPVSGSSYVSFYSPQGSVAPSLMTLPPYSNSIPLVLTDLPPTDSHACIYVEYHLFTATFDSVICRDTICFDLPQCAEDCCSGFAKAFEWSRLTSSNGNVWVAGCVSAGPNQIKRFSATIVAAQIRRSCVKGGVGAWFSVAGDFTTGSLSAALGPPQFVPTMAFSREIVWGGSNYPTCVSFNPCVPFTLQMAFPLPPTTSDCVDSLRFAVRYSFTDCNCVTCDTIVYYQLARTYIPKPWDGGKPAEPDPPHGPNDYPHLTPNPGLLNLTMSSETDGVLAVSLPPLRHDDQPAIRIVGMTLRPVGVPLTSMTEHETDNSATLDGTGGTISYLLDQGETKLFDVTYTNDDHEGHIRNFMLFRYVMPGDTAHPDTLTSDTVELYTTPPDAGGDVVENMESSTADVRTFALHMVASNNIGSAVAALRVHVNGDAKLIAVGPIGNGTDARLSSGADGDGNTVVQVDKNTWTVENVDAGSTLAPIYLTFAGVGRDAVTVDYATEAEDGSALTTGTADIASPLRVAGLERESGQMGAALMPLYPNPAAHSATAQFSLHDAGQVSIAVRDVRGNEMLRLIDGQQLGAGEHLVPFDTRSLPAGTYVVVLSVDGRVFTRPLTIVR